MGRSTSTSTDYINKLFEHLNFFEKIDNFKYNGFEIVRESSYNLGKINISNYDDIKPMVNFLFKFIGTLDYMPINMTAFKKHFQSPNEYTRIDIYLNFKSDDSEETRPRLLMFADIPMGNDTFEFDELSLSNNIENAMADLSKTLYLELGIPFDVMNREPASRIRKTMLDGKEIEDAVHFIWDEKEQHYVADFISVVIWTPNALNMFRLFVESLGGTFFTEDDHSWWTIGDDRWEANVIREKVEEKHIMSTSISKNGKDLFTYRDVYGSYTMSDLEQLLSVKIVWDNHEAVAHLKR